MSRKLIVLDGKTERELLLVGTMVVGRDPTCDISDADPLLSRRHVEFISGAKDVIVRDLGSRNGILINGVKIAQSVLRGGDVVQIGHLQVRLVEDAAPLAVAPEAGPDPDETVIATQRIQRPAALKAPSHADSPTVAPHAASRTDGPTERVPRASIADHLDGDFDKTIPTSRQGDAPPARKPKPVATPEDPDKTLFVSPPQVTPPGQKGPALQPDASDDPDKTRFISPPPVTPRAAPPPAPAARSAPVASAPPPPPVQARPAAKPAPTPVAPVAGPSTAEQAKPRVAGRPWTFFVLIQVAVLAAVVFLATAIPLILWQGRVLDATAVSRASALINWLAADATAALESTAPGAPGAIANAADDVTREPGVVSALILTTDGRVLSPASRSTETIDTIPALGARPGDILRLQQARNGGLVESVRPVPAGGRPRAAVAWITYRPSAPQEAGSGAVVLALPVIIVLVAAWFTSRVISRHTMKALTVLNEDIELAVGGKLDAIGDPLGAKPVRDLADAVNYLIARLRAAGGTEPAALPNLGTGRVDPDSRGAVRPAPSRAASRLGADRQAAVHSTAGAARESAPPLPPLEARIVVNAQYRVTDASPGCADLIGARPDALVGHHLIDAIPDREIADAVLRCLSALGPSGEHRASVEPAGRPYRLAIVVSREGKDKPLTIALTAARGANV